MWHNTDDPDHASVTVGDKVDQIGGDGYDNDCTYTAWVFFDVFYDDADGVTQHAEVSALGSGDTNFTVPGALRNVHVSEHIQYNLCDPDSFRCSQTITASPK